MGAEKHQPDDKIQSEGRKGNAAQHLNSAPDNAGAERYPPTNKDDSIEATGEARSFEGVENPQPRQGAGDGGPDPSVNHGHADPDAAPAADKR